MQTPAGWYDDPLGRFDHRYWDGTRWTEHVSRAGQQATDPLDGTPPAAAATDDVPDDVAAEPVTAESLTSGAETSEPQTSEPQTSEPVTAGTGATGGAAASSWATPGTTAAGPPPTGASTPPWPSTGVPATPPYQPGAVPGERRTNVQAVLSLVFSLIWILGIGSLVAIVLGVVGIRRIDASEGRETGKGLAIAGIVLGVLGLLSTVLFVAGLAVFARDVGLSLDQDGQVVFDESALFEEDEWARWTALYDTAAAQETHWYTHDRYASDLGELRDAGLELEPGTQLTVPTATSDAFCLELVDAEGIWHLDSDFYEVEEGPCPLG